MKYIPITKVCIDEAELEAVLEPLRSGWLVQGPRVEEFERKFCAFTGAEHAIATTSCTSALHLALAAGGVGPGDEVVVPAFTWVSSANAAVYLGATPVFCDIDLDTFNLDVRLLEECITPRTRAVIPVHLFGLSADMDPIMDLARRHDLLVVEDAACGFGAWNGGRHVGTIGNYGCFSFHPRKSITTGEGGMITTSDDDGAALSRMLRDHGADRTDLDRHHGAQGFLLPAYDQLGYNYRMTDLQGAIGSAQMDKAGHILECRKAGANYYDELLRPVHWLRRPFVPEGCEHGYQSYVCLFAPEEPSLSRCRALNDLRNALMQELDARGIASRQGTHAVTGLGFYRRRFGVEPHSYPNAHLAEHLSLTLPLYPQMERVEQEYVVDHLISAYELIRCAA